MTKTENKTTPRQYLQAGGLDFTAVEAIAAKGPSETDVELCDECGLNPEDLHTYCVARVAQAENE